MCRSSPACPPESRSLFRSGHVVQCFPTRHVMDSDGSSENELLRQTETLSPVGAISVHSDLRDNEISNPDLHFVNPIEPDAAYCVLSSRQDQMFPLLSE